MTEFRVGDRVHFDGDITDTGTIVALDKNIDSVSVEWDSPGLPKTWTYASNLVLIESAPVKTPEEIADSFLHPYYVSDTYYADEVRGLIVGAINADRAQR